MPSHQKRLALLAAITPSPDVVRDWRARFETRAKKILNSHLIPSERLSIQTVIDMLEWELFGEPDANLPATQFIMQHFTTGALSVRSRFLDYVAFDGSPYRIDFEDIIRDEFSDLLSEQKEFMLGKDGQPPTNEAQIVAATKALLKDSAQYRLLRSLTIATPILEEKPLSVAERQLRENSLRDSMLGPLDKSPERYGAGGFAAHRALARKKYLLDQQTKPRGELQGETRAKALSWMIEEAQGWWPRELRESPITKVMLGFLGDVEGIFVGDAAGTQYSVENKVLDWSREIEKDPIEKLYVPGVSEKLCYEFVREFCRDQTGTPSQILEKVVDNLAHDWAWTGTSPDKINIFYFRKLLFALRQPPGPIYDKIPANAEAGTIPVFYSIDSHKGGAGSTTTKISVQSKESEKELERITRARVARRDFHDGLPRLLLQQPRAHEYPPLSKSVWYRLILDVEDGADDSKEPHIPGYVAVANSGKRWAFQRAKDDPHGGAEQVLIPTSGIQNLIQTYQNIGLQTLAKALAEQEKRQGQVSAADLQNLVRRFSDYTHDNSYAVTTPDAPELKDFATCHKKGRLQVQCSGAATFLAASFRLALPDCQSHVVDGSVLDFKDRIDGVRHAQTVLQYGEHLYVLDATPDHPLRSELQNALAKVFRTRANNNQRREASVSTAAEYLAHQTDDDKIVTIEEIEESLFSASEITARAQLEATLQNALGVSKADLYKKAKTFQMRDPLRIALEAAAGRPGTNIASAIEYLEKYSGDPSTQIRISRLTGRRYDPQLTQLAADSLRPLLSKPVPPSEITEAVNIQAATMPQITTTKGFHQPPR